MNFSRVTTKVVRHQSGSVSRRRGFNSRRLHHSVPGCVLNFPCDAAVAFGTPVALRSPREGQHMNAHATGRVLYLTPLSHFSRKVRIVLRELDLSYDESYVPNLLSADPADFGGNPILRVP